MRTIRDLGARLAWAFVNWWLARAGRIAVPLYAVRDLPPIVERMQGHVQRSGHLARVYHVRWTLDMALADIRAAIARLK